MLQGFQVHNLCFFTLLVHRWWTRTWMTSFFENWKHNVRKLEWTSYSRRLQERLWPDSLCYADVDCGIGEKQTYCGSDVHLHAYTAYLVSISMTGTRFELFSRSEAKVWLREILWKIQTYLSFSIMEVWQCYEIIIPIGDREEEWAGAKRHRGPSPAEAHRIISFLRLNRNHSPTYSWGQSLCIYTLLTTSTWRYASMQEGLNSISHIHPNTFCF